MCNTKKHLCWCCENATSMYKCPWVSGVMPKDVVMDNEGNFIKCPLFEKDRKPYNFSELPNDKQAEIFHTSVRTWFRRKSEGNIIKFMQKQKEKYNIDTSKYTFKRFFEEMEK